MLYAELDESFVPLPELSAQRALLPGFVDVAAKHWVFEQADLSIQGVNNKYLPYTRQIGCRGRPAGVDCQSRHRSRTHTQMTLLPSRSRPLLLPRVPLPHLVRSWAHFLGRTYPHLLSYLRHCAKDAIF